MKKTLFILCLLSILSSCVFTIKIPPEEKTPPPVEESDSSNGATQ